MLYIRLLLEEIMSNTPIYISDYISHIQYHITAI